ncbi:non-homologous end-joining DNA ligase [Natranaerobius trueperi]|uniref:non-homologous end-joining DNA ligase n=1 Tax=Natranaerobius trueperi TaxID=759412 RepID=UPI00130392F8|nr:non-homologous end-joining DNA ligase [Natranaerobius trueperi]
MTKKSEVLNIQGKEVYLTNLTKIIWPQKKLTKFHLIKYLLDIYPYISPHLKDRPLVMTRYPDGINNKGFYQKDISKIGNLPDWLTTVDLSSGDETIRYVIVDHPATLVWLGNLAAIELHPWLSRINNLEKPDYVVFDLDPMPDAEFSKVKRLAFEFKKLIEQYSQKGYLKLTGSSGLQIFVPLQPKYTYSQVREYAKSISEEIVRENFKIATIERSVRKRDSKKVYLDYLQNVKGKTISTIYGPRANSGAFVSAPVTWDELEKNVATSKTYDLFSVVDRVKQFGDLFESVLNEKYSL